MSIQAKKYHLIEWITSIQDIRLINKLVKIAEDSDWWDSLSEEEKASIERGINDLENGRTIDHSEARNIYGKYL